MANENGKAQEKKDNRRWSIGCFRNDRGKLVTVYVSKEGEPMPYVADRVGDRPILAHGVFSEMPYREARVELIKQAEKAGHPERVEPEAEKAEAAPAKATTKKAAPKKATAKKATAKKGTKAATKK